jgi:hypothetical protein|tara:strand:+ start:42 stop:419 length:378 start_codon:yes stop_codon:yes gene_type:complete
MGYNMSNDIPLGQLGSGFTDGTSAVNPPTGKVIIAVTFMSDLTVTTLAAETPTDATFKGPQTSAGVAEINSFGTAIQTPANGANSQRTSAAEQVFPKGLTIYGRWKEFALQAADTTGGAILYYGY